MSNNRKIKNLNNNNNNNNKIKRKIKNNFRKKKMIFLHQFHYQMKKNVHL